MQTPFLETAKQRVCFVHPTGNPNARHAALALAEAGSLGEIVTTFAIGNREWALIGALPGRLRSELSRRFWPSPLGVPLRRHPWREATRITLERAGIARAFGLRQRCVDWVYSALDRHVARHHLSGVTAVYAFEDGAANTFSACKKSRIHCLYDLPIVHYRKNREVQEAEACKFPEFRAAFQALMEPAWKVERKEMEIALADHIFVASSVTRTSLLDAGVSADRITVVPYGAPLEFFSSRPHDVRGFMALFVGRISPQKGIHYLLDAWKQLGLPRAELRLIGTNHFPSGWLRRYGDCFTRLGSVPHVELARHYSEASVFVLPSLIEGFGLVLLEAMACGVPVITTSSTGGAEVIEEGVDGFVVPTGDVEALKERLEWCYRNPDLLAEMGKAARVKAEKLSWQRYRETLAREAMVAMR